MRLTSNTIKAALFAITVIFSTNIFASEYPRTKTEEEVDEMGSVLGGEGLVFRPTLTKSDATSKTIGNVNKYMFDAALESLEPAKILVADNKTGVIESDWHRPAQAHSSEYKVMIQLSGKTISPEGIKVIAKERKKIEDRWFISEAEPKANANLAGNILRLARQKYNNEKNQ